MRMSKTLSKLAVVMLAGAAAALVGMGCGEKESARATTQAEPAKTGPKVEPRPSPEMTAAFEAFKKAQNVPVARVPVVSAPQVDGVLDAVYKKATPLKFKFLAGGEAEPTGATTVYAVCTAKELFLFYNCESPDMDALWAEVRDHDGAVWGDDSVELFIDPTNKRQIDGYVHFAVNALGTTYEAKGPKGDADASWDPKLRVKTKVGKKAWTVELAIPFAELVKDPAKLTRVWAINFNRMARLLEADEDTAWSPTGSGDSHVPTKFGVIWLDAGKVDNTKD